MRVVFGLLLVILGISVFVQIPIFHFLVALVIIGIGWKVLTGEHHGNRRMRHHARMSHQSVSHDLDEVRVLGETRRKVESDDFDDGRAIAVLGGLDIDMSNVKTSSKIVYLELVAVLGEIKIRIPKNWKVVNKSTAVAGGIDDQTSGSGSVTLKITGATVLGGIEIYN